jgi:DNA-binding response OmpR family regulator
VPASERILVVEDEPAVAQAIAHMLKREGYLCAIARDGEEAIRFFHEFKPALVLLDVKLPGLDGLEVCRVLRKTSGVPIILVTALGAEADRVLGLEVGADDYVTKPFSMRELLARVRAALRRQEMLASAPGEIQFDDGYLSVDTPRHEVSANGRVVGLSPREFGLLQVLLRHRGHVRTRSQLLQEAWGGDEYVDPRTVDVHVHWLRQKIEPDPDEPKYIQTVRGLGYRFGQ